MSRLLVSDLALRWIVTTLFGGSIATYAYVLVAQRRRWTSTLSDLLHLTMSAAMMLMAWHVGLHLLPTIGPITFFILAGAWFICAASRVSWASSQRLTNYYYAVMMAAMAWMYASMTGALPGHSGHSHDHAQSGPWVMSMSAAEVPAQDMAPTAPGPGWITHVNWIAALGFAVVAMYWPCRYLAERRTTPTPPAAQLGHVQMLGQAFSAAGTALMFAATL
jgi:hypothetical protein